jgi:hypothetical protein
MSGGTRTKMVEYHWYRERLQISSDSKIELHTYG